MTAGPVRRSRSRRLPCKQPPGQGAGIADRTRQPAGPPLTRWLRTPRDKIGSQARRPPHVYHGHHMSLVVDSIDDPVGATARAEAVVHRRKKPLPDPAGVSQEGAGDELAGGCRDGFGKGLPQRAADGRGCPELIRLFCVPAHRARRCLITSASSSAENCNPNCSHARPGSAFACIFPDLRQGATLGHCLPWHMPAGLGCLRVEGDGFGWLGWSW
jgi:hypothetical protein